MTEPPDSPDPPDSPGGTATRPMLLQTNSYIVPKERRAEHARLVQRFRHTMRRLGCDGFEVYEQVGAHWGGGETTGRFVQIMRFVDRRHQQAVQRAEQHDPAAQALIRDFCDLINMDYQRQQGLFASGYYQGVMSAPAPGTAPGTAGPEPPPEPPPTNRRPGSAGTRRPRRAAADARADARADVRAVDRNGTNGSTHSARPAPVTPPATAEAAVADPAFVDPIEVDDDEVDPIEVDDDEVVDAPDFLDADAPVRAPN